MNRKSKRLLDRSAPVQNDHVDPRDHGPEVENVDSGGGGGGGEGDDMEMTPFVDTGSAVPIVVDASAAVIPVDIDMSDGVVTVADPSTAAGGGGDVVVAVDVDVRDDIAVERGGYDVVGSAETAAVSASDGDGAVVGGRRGRAKTAKEEKAERYDQAVQEFLTGAWKSVRACATHFRVDHTTLGRLVKDPEAKFKGRGNVSKVFLPEEEDSIVGHIIWCMEHGCGLDIFQVRFLSF